MPFVSEGHAQGVNVGHWSHAIDNRQLMKTYAEARGREPRTLVRWKFRDGEVAVRTHTGGTYDAEKIVKCEDKLVWITRVRENEGGFRYLASDRVDEWARVSCFRKLRSKEKGGRDFSRVGSSGKKGLST